MVERRWRDDRVGEVREAGGSLLPVRSRDKRERRPAPLGRSAGALLSSGELPARIGILNGAGPYHLWMGIGFPPHEHSPWFGLQSVNPVHYVLPSLFDACLNLRY